MPSKPRGKSKTNTAHIERLREQVQQQREREQQQRDQQQRNRPPTTQEYQQQQQQHQDPNNNNNNNNQQSRQSISFVSGGTGSAAANRPPPKQSNNNNNNNSDNNNNALSSSAFIPPGADIQSANNENAFLYQFEEHFTVPRRLRRVPTPLVEGVNDFHFAMMNDLPRNEFYYEMLREAITPGETTVLEIGGGSGLLSMMAASLGAKWVVAVEGSTDMARLAARNIDNNNLSARVHVLNKMSSELRVGDLPAQPDVLVSEIFGTLLLGESALEYLEDIRHRGITKSSTVILPRFGRQYACLVECPVLEQICAVGRWRDLDLTMMNSLRDTASCVFTKKYGFRLNSVPFRRLTDPIPLLDLDFTRTRVRDVDIAFSLDAKVRAAGTAHAWLYWWIAWNKPEDIAGMTVGADGAHANFDQVKVMSTCPTATRDNFPRDMQWGQALQLVDIARGAPLPKPLTLPLDPALCPMLGDDGAGAGAGGGAAADDEEASAMPALLPAVGDAGGGAAAAAGDESSASSAAAVNTNTTVSVPLTARNNKIIVNVCTSEDRVILQCEVETNEIGNDAFEEEEEDEEAAGAAAGQAAASSGNGKK